MAIIKGLNPGDNIFYYEDYQHSYGRREPHKVHNFAYLSSRRARTQGEGFPPQFRPLFEALNIRTADSYYRRYDIDTRQWRYDPGVLAVGVYIRQYNDPARIEIEKGRISPVVQRAINRLTNADMAGALSASFEENGLPPIPLQPPEEIARHTPSSEFILDPEEVERSLNRTYYLAENADRFFQQTGRYRNW